MVEWSITAVLKTAVPRGTGGSNPSLSATESCKSKDLQDFFNSLFFDEPKYTKNNKKS